MCIRDRRILPPGAAFGDPALGRVISARRRCGVGSVLLNEGIEAVRELYGALPITIEAQVYAKQFYEKAGFVQVSEPFDEDGIPHIRIDVYKRQIQRRARTLTELTFRQSGRV